MSANEVKKHIKNQFNYIRKRHMTLINTATKKEVGSAERFQSSVTLKLSIDTFYRVKAFGQEIKWFEANQCHTVQDLKNKLHSDKYPKEHIIILLNGRELPNVSQLFGHEKAGTLFEVQFKSRIPG